MLTINLYFSDLNLQLFLNRMENLRLKLYIFKPSTIKSLKALTLRKQSFFFEQ